MMRKIRPKKACTPRRVRIVSHEPARTRAKRVRRQCHGRLARAGETCHGRLARVPTSFAKASTRKETTMRSYKPAKSHADLPLVPPPTHTFSLSLRALAVKLSALVMLVGALATGQEPASNLCNGHNHDKNKELFARPFIDVKVEVNGQAVTAGDELLDLRRTARSGLCLRRRHDRVQGDGFR